ncbi:Tyrosinase central domain containing protein [Pleurostoma richardsiae]|uniref:Tyrosinase central domain containing protein n=1 Tax=Pleurostoma richardsiae TaxID=41990 RepID=A0AA38RAI0_9PEZI|nr:Tyrosinase central domain containing protein [Pleurostoma richardsiae]
MHHPSIFHRDTSFYDDFIFAHSKTGVYSHYAAAFLPWHRMYVHVFEQSLRRKCEYNGPLPYWDWTLDSADLAASPVWDATDGFGGDGNHRGPETVHHGRCVLDGPFANTTRAWNALSEGHSHDVALAPHCLSRGFTTDPDLLAALQRLVSPQYVQGTLDQPDYASFFKKFEEGAHNAIPQFIKGDFLTFSAPNDPIFFLHHAQVDRLWWIWQQRDTETRLKEFHGPAEDFRFHEDPSASSKADVLPMAGLAEDRTVEDVMDAAGGFLCYRY